IFRLRLFRFVRVGRLRQMFPGHGGPATASGVDGGVPRDPEDPGGEWQPAFIVGGDRLQSLQEDLLAGVGGIFSGRKPGEEVTVDPWEVPLIEPAEGDWVMSCRGYQRRF